MSGRKENIDILGDLLYNQVDGFEVLKIILPNYLILLTYNDFFGGLLNV